MHRRPAVHSTNYYDTFITISPDSDAIRGTPPPEKTTPSVALLTFRMLHGQPYRYTSDDVIFTVFADRRGIPPGKRAAARQEFFAKPQACFRSSDLAKKYGWGIHANGEGRVALYGVGTVEYRQLSRGKLPGKRDQTVTVKPAMRSRR